MKLSNYKEVEKLVEIKGRCEDALEEAETFIDRTMRDPDPGGVDGFKDGFWASLCEHRAGRRVRVDMTGCYVGKQVGEAVADVLVNQIEEIKERLQALGVEVDA